MTAPRKPVDGALAISAIVINQLATPGLGSIMARHYLAGAGQLCAAILGVGVFMGWFLQLFQAVSAMAEDGMAEVHLNFTFGILGLAIFGGSWLWAGFTSITIWRESKHPLSPPSGGVPPLL